MNLTMIRAEAGEMGHAQTFSIEVHNADEGETGYWGEVEELPGCLSQGETLDELAVNMREAIEAVVQR